MRDYLECDQCSEVVFESDEDGCYSEGDTDFCRGCGLICSISVDEWSDDASVDDWGDGARAYLSTTDEAKDIGQPKCDRSCGAVKEFNGTPCLWDCARAKEFCDAWRSTSEH